MPDDYRPLLKSDIADTKNVSGSRYGGAITAALFLAKFVGQGRWAHIDIAGPAYVKKPADYGPAGGTGFGFDPYYDPDTAPSGHTALRASISGNPTTPGGDLYALLPNPRWFTPNAAFDYIDFAGPGGANGSGAQRRVRVSSPGTAAPHSPRMDSPGSTDAARRAGR